jgi:hypothetical protein
LNAYTLPILNACTLRNLERLHVTKSGTLAVANRGSVIRIRVLAEVDDVF